jgi:hypothetical protein
LQQKDENDPKQKKIQNNAGRGVLPSKSFFLRHAGGGGRRDNDESNDNNDYYAAL